MKHSLRALVLGASLLLSATPSLAGPALDKASACLADNTSGKDRKVLARWMFLAMGAHPEIRSLSNATPADQEETSRLVADLITRLLTENCRGEIQNLVRMEGSGALTNAFEFLGKSAMQELLTNKDVSGSIEQYIRYVDKSKINGLFEKR